MRKSRFTDSQIMAVLKQDGIKSISAAHAYLSSGMEHIDHGLVDVDEC